MQMEKNRSLIYSVVNAHEVTQAAGTGALNEFSRCDFSGTKASSKMKPFKFQKYVR